MTQSIVDVLEESDWINKNKEAIKNLLPETWTHVGNLNPIAMGFQLKLIGADWRNKGDFCKILSYLQGKGIILVDGLCIRRNHNA